MGGIIILSSFKFHVNLVQHPSNNKSIVKEKQEDEETEDQYLLAVGTFGKWQFK